MVGGGGGNGWLGEKNENGHVGKKMKKKGSKTLKNGVKTA